MVRYIQYANNFNGFSGFDKLSPSIRDAIITVFLDQVKDFNELQKAVIQESNVTVYDFISENLDLTRYYKSIIFTTDKSSYIDYVDFENIHAIINFRQVNQIQYIDKLLSSINRLLPDAGIYLGRLETCANRKERILRKFGTRLGVHIWVLDYLVNRIIPRIPYLEDIYFYLTKGRSHAISDAEMLGRLAYAGFEIIGHKIIGELTYFAAQKTRMPCENEKPSYYPIIKLNRVGKGGKIIGVYKFRTMHPYAEYLQDYVIKLNGYNDKGKPANDFRITRWGWFIRRLWIDELPQIINVLKGEMKLVGLRPLSRYRFNEFPEDLKTERIKYKPGCIPPYVALNMPDDQKNIEAERIYIKDLARHPYLTDFRYFLKGVYNILTNKIRSS